MSCHDISRIVFELVRQHDDRLCMSSEDERCRFLREISKLRRSNASLKRSLVSLNKCYESLEEAVNKNASTVLVSGSICRPVNKFARGSEKKGESKEFSNEEEPAPANVDKNSSRNDDRSANVSEAYQHPKKKRIVTADGRRATVCGSGTFGTAAMNTSHPKCVSVVRNSCQRDSLPGHKCSECSRYFDALKDQGIMLSQNQQEILRNCSRHKAQWSPPATAAGYWDLSVNTPEDWKES